MKNVGINNGVDDIGSLNDTYNNFTKGTLKKPPVETGGGVEVPLNPNEVSNATGTETGTGSSNETGSNFEEMAKNPFGDLEMTKFLYENGLQNIFDDYQKNVETLSQAEKQNLQDAYYIKEMSKKYLGEYASNTGIGDVSGSLVDIYGKYQENVGEIQGNYDALELNLAKEYQSERINGFNNIMMTQYNIEAAKMDASSQDILFNVQTGNTGELNAFDYLESVKDTLRDEDYQAIYGTLYTQQMQEITSNIQNGFYGYNTDADGNKVRETDPQAYLDTFKDTFSDSDFNQLQGVISNVSSQKTASTIMNDISTGNYVGTRLEYLESMRDQISPDDYQAMYSQLYAQTVMEIENNLTSGYYGYKDVEVENSHNGDPDANIDGVAGAGVNTTTTERQAITDPLEYLEQYKDDLSPKHYQQLVDQLTAGQEEANSAAELGKVTDFRDPTSESYQPNFDPTYYFGDTPDISSNSQVYEFLGQQHVQVDVNVDQDENLPTYVDSEMLFEYYEGQNPDGIPNAGEILNYRGTYYAFNNGNWNRLVSGQGSGAMQSYAEANQANWSVDGKRATSSDGAYKNNKNKPDTLTYNGTIYTENKDDNATFNSGDANADQGLIDYFKEIHPGTSDDGIAYQSVVFYEGRFWVYNTNSRFTPMKKGE